MTESYIEFLTNDPKVAKMLSASGWKFEIVHHPSKSDKNTHGFRHKWTPKEKALRKRLGL